MEYTKIFNPQSIQQHTAEAHLAADLGDRSEAAYVYTEKIVLAVNVALATARPLLIRGPSGSGKSSLASNVSGVLQRRYYEKVISSRTQAQDLLWEVDHLHRLQDAQAGNLSKDYTPYIHPGVFWWAFDQSSAQVQHHNTLPTEQLTPEDQADDNTAAVVLLDEMDKADPDVPNNLLVPLGSLRFQVEQTGETVSAQQAPLVIITTNNERELPTAFLRRCVELKLEAPDYNKLVEIGRAHFQAKNEQLLEQVAELIAQAHAGNNETPPCAAEYLDTVRACLDLKIEPGSPEWKQLAKITVWKHGRKSNAV